MSIRLYVGNLPRELQRQEFEDVFAGDSESIVSVKLIADRKTGKCRGFGFVTVKSDELADVLVEKYNGYQLQDASLKVEKALPRSKEGNEAVAEAPAANANGNSRRNKKNNRKTGGQAASTTNSTAETEAVRPDPRWAQELEKLKELLAAQTTAP